MEQDSNKPSSKWELRQHYLSMLMEAVSHDDLKAIILDQSGHIWTPSEPGWVFVGTCWRNLNATYCCTLC